VRLSTITSLGLCAAPLLASACGGPSTSEHRASVTGSAARSAAESGRSGLVRDGAIDSESKDTASQGLGVAQAASNTPDLLWREGLLLGPMRCDLSHLRFIHQSVRLFRRAQPDSMFGHEPSARRESAGGCGAPGTGSACIVRQIARQSVSCECSTGSARPWHG